MCISRKGGAVGGPQEGAERSEMASQAAAPTRHEGAGIARRYLLSTAPNPACAPGISVSLTRHAERALHSPHTPGSGAAPCTCHWTVGHAKAAPARLTQLAPRKTRDSSSRASQSFAMSSARAVLEWGVSRAPRAGGLSARPISCQASPAPCRGASCRGRVAAARAAAGSCYRRPAAGPALTVEGAA
jgi:hypothetical protein